MPAHDDGLARDGWASCPGLLRGDQVQALRIAATARGIAGPVRDAFAAIPVTQAVALDERVQRVAAEALGADPVVVRATWFDKGPGCNWPVAWHQDKTVPVDERVESPGWGPWSLKDGHPHVEPPFDVLAAMVAIRILLDDCDADAGPLRVVPGTHRAKLARPEIEAAVARGPVVDCVGAAGDAMVMRPLLVHGSRRCAAARHRRVLHIEFAAGPLPPPLRWRAVFG